ncbi:phospholipase A [Helicobacter sp. T3_23-1056]
MKQYKFVGFVLALILQNIYGVESNMDFSAKSSLESNIKSSVKSNIESNAKSMESSQTPQAQTHEQIQTQTQSTMQENQNPTEQNLAKSNSQKLNATESIFAESNPTESNSQKSPPTDTNPTKSTTDKSTKTRLKNHFFSPQTYKERAKKAQNAYKYYMQIFEHEGTYFLFYHSFTPVWGINDNNELKFQLSAKIPIWRGAFWSKGSLFFGYTQTMWFNQFNFRYSSPVRDTDYKPSIFYAYPAEWRFLGGLLQELRLGFLHYSNGIGGEECKRESFSDPTPAGCRSRSAANRLIFEAIWESDFSKNGTKVNNAGDFGIHISAWPYIQKRKDNLELHKYMGYANVRFYYRHSRHLAEVHFTPIIVATKSYYPSVRVGYSFGISDFVSLYAQYFYGYGDNLYEYDKLSHRLGIGLRIRSF